MSFLDLVHKSAEALSQHTPDPAEHEAVVDLVVLAAYADNQISQDELLALEKLDLDHMHWDEGTFSVMQYLPVAMAKARAAHEDGAHDQLLQDIAARIKTKPLRIEALRYCMAEVADSGVNVEETAFIAKARRALA